MKTTSSPLVSQTLMRLVCLFLFGHAFSVGCITTPNERDNVREAMNDFHRQLHWGAYGMAQSFVVPKMRRPDHGWAQLERNEIELKDFEVHEVVASSQHAGEFDVFGTVHLIDVSSQRARSLSLAEHWKKVDEQWVVEPHWMQKLIISK